VSVDMARTPWLESACGSRRKESSVDRPEGESSSPPGQGDARSSAGVSPETLAEACDTRLTRIGLLLVALILLGLFSCPPRAYARLAKERRAGVTLALLGF
jgi:hypothetical protein